MATYRPKPKGKLEHREVNNHKNYIAPECLPVPENKTCNLRFNGLLGSRDPKLKAFKRRPFML